MLPPFAHPVECYCVLLGVFAQSLKPVNSRNFCCSVNRRRVAQQCWVRLHRYSDIAGATHAHYTWSSHDALQVPILLGAVAHFYTPLLTRTQQLSTLLAQQCWQFKKSLCHQATVQNHSLINKHSVQK